MPPLLFVNKTAKSSSLTKSDGLERSQIHSHVQRTFVVPGQAISPSLSEGRLALPDRSTSVPSASSKRVQDVRGRRTSKASARRSLSAAAVPPTESETPDLSVSPSPGPDPLNDAPLTFMNINGAPYMDILLKFYQNPLINRIFPSRSQSGQTYQFTINLATQDTALLYSLLCSTASAWYVDSGNPQHKLGAVYFKGQALVALRQGLFAQTDRDPSMSSLMAIALLLWNECIQGDVNHAVAHIAGLQSLVARYKNFENSPLPIASTVFGCASMSSAMLRTRPKFDPAPPTIGYVADKVLAAIDTCPEQRIKIMGSRFFSPSNEAVMGPDLADLVLEQHICLAFRELCREDYLDPEEDDTKSIYSRQTHLEHRLVCMQFDGLDLSPATNAVRLACYTYAQPIITITKPWSAFARSLAQQLRESLERTDLDTNWGQSADMLLWVLFITAYVSRGQTQWHWCFYHISRLIDALGLQTIEDTRALLQGFLWYGITFEDALYDVYKALEKTQRDEISTFSFESYHGHGVVSFKRDTGYSEPAPPP